MYATCHCGDYKACLNADPFQVSYCHCRDCRKATGAPVTVFAGFRMTDIILESGIVKAYRSSRHVDRLSCAACGSPVGYTDDRLRGEIYIYIGLIDDADRLMPHLHAWTSEKLPWVRCDDGLVKYTGFSRKRF